LKYLIFANGDVNDGTYVQETLISYDDAYVICADGGVRIADYFARKIDIVIGDMDSVSPTRLQELEDQNVTLLRYSPEKDETDLELALLYVAQQGATSIRILGALGNRFDQTIANTLLLSLEPLQDCDVALVADNQQIRLLNAGTHQLSGNIGDTISLIPIGGDVQNLQTTHLLYPLHHETLYFGLARGISNVMEHKTATVSFTDGQLLLVHCLS